MNFTHCVGECDSSPFQSIVTPVSFLTSYLLMKLDDLSYKISESQESLCCYHVLLSLTFSVSW